MDFISLASAMKEAPHVTYLEIKHVPEASGIYTAWSKSDTGCFYVGKANSLASRLRSHYSGQRGSNQFCLYVYDRYVQKVRPPNLTTAQVNTLTAQWIRDNISFRWVKVAAGELSTHEAYLRQKWHPILNALD